MQYINGTVYRVNTRYRLFLLFDKDSDTGYLAPMGRPPLGIRATQVRLSEETRERIREIVGDSGMAQFVREAVERELKRRERQKD